MKRFILPVLVVIVLLLAACTTPTITQTVTVTSTAAPETTSIVTITSTETSTVTVNSTNTQTVIITSPSVVEQAGRLPTCEVGDKWVWSYVMDEKTYTLTEEVIGEETVEGRDCYIIDMSFDPLLSYTHSEEVSTITSMKYWMDKATGLYGIKMETSGNYDGTEFTSIETYSYNPWAPLFPLEIGKEVETEKTTTQYSNGDQVGEPVVTIEKYKLDSMDDVAVTAGTYSCWKIILYDGKDNITQTVWWSDKVKSMVKGTDAAGNTTMELQSFATAPSTTPTLDQSQISTPGNTGLEGDWWLSQGFIPSKPLITAVEIYIGSVHANLSYPLNLQIRSDDNGLPSGTILASTSVPISQSAWDWITFDIPDIEIIPGTRYHLVLSSASNYHTGLDSTNPYPSGCMCYSTDAGGTWRMLHDNQNYDMAFKIHGSATPTTVPPMTTPQTFNITGTWSGNWWRSDSGEEGTLIATLIQSGGSLNGDMTFTSTTFEYSQDTTISGTVEGSEVVFGMAISSNGETVTIDYEGTISEDGNQMSGTYYISTGWTGTWSVVRD
ncbi:hypothetical protein ACFLY3_04200 [Chloroflexota bacterium]